MTDEGERAVADLAAEIMSADRPATQAKDGPRDKTLGEYLVWAWLVITVAYIVGMGVLAILFGD